MMEISPEIQNQIIKVRQDNPHLTAHMSDEEIVTLLHQADQTIAQTPEGGFATFVRSQGAYGENLHLPVLKNLKIFQLTSYLFMDKT